jgi:hypothetical protein
MVPELRARGIGEILDAAVVLYRARFARLITVAAWVIIPTQALSALVLLSAQPDRFETGVTGAPTAVYDGGDVAVQIAATVVVAALGIITSAFVVAACARIVADAYVDYTEPAGDAIRLAGRRVLPIIGLALIVAAAQFAGIFACGVGAFVAMTFFAVAIPVLIIEGTGVFRALGRSIELTKTKFWHVLGLVLAAQLLTLVLQGGLTALLELGLSSDNTTVLVIMQSVVNTVSAMITTPFVAAATLVLYFDLRVRVEGFDIQLLMQRVDARYAGSATPVAPVGR